MLQWLPRQSISKTSWAFVNCCQELCSSMVHFIMAWPFPCIGSPASLPMLQEIIISLQSSVVCSWSEFNSFGIIEQNIWSTLIFSSELCNWRQLRYFSWWILLLFLIASFDYNINKINLFLANWCGCSAAMGFNFNSYSSLLKMSYPWKVDYFFENVSPLTSVRRQWFQHYSTLASTLILSLFLLPF